MSSPSPIMAGMTLRTFMTVMNRLLVEPWVHLDKVPAAAQPALQEFIPGHTLSMQAGRSAMPPSVFAEFHQHVVYGAGLSYPVQFESDPQP